MTVHNHWQPPATEQAHTVAQAHITEQAHPVAQAHAVREAARHPRAGASRCSGQGPTHTPSSVAWCYEGARRAERGDAPGAVAVLSRAVEACLVDTEHAPERLWPAVEGSITLASAWEAVGHQERAREAWRDARTLVHQLQRCFPGTYDATMALVAAHEVRARHEAGQAGLREVREAAEAARRHQLGSDVVEALLRLTPLSP